MSDEKRFVVVTTDQNRRGVFGGYLKFYDQDKAIVILEDAHMAVYWSKETRGVLGLAAIGPQRGSRITPAIPQIELNGVTALMNATEEAIGKWREASWE